MKRLSLALPVLLMAAQLALADQSGPPAGGPPPGGPRGGPPIERLAKDLNLDATQKAEVQRILEAQRAKREAAREKFRASGERPTREQMQANMQQDDQQLLQQLSGVLDSVQMTRFKELQAERRNHMHGGPPPDGGPPPGGPSE